MKPLVYGLAGASVLVALVAGPVAGQARPGTSGGGGGTAVRTGGSSGGGGGAAVRAGGSSGGSSGGGGAVARSGGTSSGASSSNAGSSGTGRAAYSPGSSSSGSSSGGGSTARGGTAWLSNPVNGSSPIVRRLYGSAGDTAVPRGARPGGVTPYVGTTIGHAIPRQPSTPIRAGRPPHGGTGGGDINWGYAPWIFAGLGFYNVLYADPYWLTGYWFPYEYGYDYDPDWDPAEAGDAGYYGDEQAGIGGLRLKVSPSSAEVLVDGYYMGTVGDFNGVFQRMDLTAGPHHVEVRAPGFRAIAFDVRIEPNDTVTYRGELQPVSRQ